MSDNNKNSTLRELLSTKGLDEMQTGHIYKVAYNCFRAFFWANFIISIVITAGISVIKHPMVAIFSSLLALTTSIIYLVFVGCLAKTGSLPSTFAKKGGLPIIGGVLLAICLTGITNYFEDGNVYILLEGIPLLIFAISFIITALLTLKNNKILKQQESEEE
ncbi:MAG: hypothetical protein IJC83_06545 [Oscillospiraceae bacterium]|nr:hypothetical protein [Oscillospiraceae bacterium]